MANKTYNKPHFFLQSYAQSKNFTAKGSGGGNPQVIPAQNRITHSGKLRGDLSTISTRLDELKAEALDVPLKMGLGIQVEFESFPDIDIAVEKLANATQKIELQQGRVRKAEQWGPRTLDLDILLYGQQQIETENLNIPHIGMKQREFVLYPLYEIAPDLILPSGEKLRELVKACPANGLQKL